MAGEVDDVCQSDADDRMVLTPAASALYSLEAKFERQIFAAAGVSSN